jgi:hypothetical protein
MNKINEIVQDVIDNVLHNWKTYSAAGLLTVTTACRNTVHRDQVVEYDGSIGKNKIYAEKWIVTRENAKHENYSIKKTLPDGASVSYSDISNDLFLDNVVIVSPDGNRQVIKDASVLSAARKDYRHLRDTIPYLVVASKKAKAKREQPNIEKYFGR